jgi:hypothetical protein
MYSGIQHEKPTVAIVAEVRRERHRATDAENPTPPGIRLLAELPFTKRFSDSEKAPCDGEHKIR